MKNINSVINNFQNKKILVIGDLMLDVYLNGVSNRLTPEAPVPVVDVVNRKQYLGGAGNTACNFRSLGAKVTVISAIGSDSPGNDILRILDDLGISVETILRVRERETLVKTRIVSDGHIITRFDSGTFAALEAQAIKELIDLISVQYENYDAVVISDYNKGVITEEVVHAIKKLQNCHNKFIAIDSKQLPFFASLEPDLVKPNYEEAMKLLRLNPSSNHRREQIIAEGERLTAQTNAKIVAITLDRDGSIFFKNGKFIHHSSAPSVASPHVSGAGDTFIAAFVLAFVSQGGISAAAEIATTAAAVAIQKESTSSCFIHELKRNLQLSSKLLHSMTELKELSDDYHREGKRIVFTNGCFDILHSGHVSYLRNAKALGDVLIVGINTDESIKRIKGNSRPINFLQDRAEVLSALTCVDHLIAFGSEEDDTPAGLIRLVRPHVFVKGGDYSVEKLPEAKAVVQAGGEIVFISLVPDHSTTTIIQRINSIQRTPDLTPAVHE